MIKKISLYLMSIFYVVAGVNHFRVPEFYRPMMPPLFPAHDFLIGLSGAIEIALGLLLLYKPTRRFAAFGVILLLIAIFPANVYMYQLGGARFNVSDTALLIRLPLQLVLIGWAYIHTRREA